MTNRNSNENKILMEKKIEQHIPVLKKEVIDCLSPGHNENFIDCTIGFAGHAKEILKLNGPKGKVLGIDWDSEVIQKLQEDEELKSYGERIKLVVSSYIDIKDIMDRLNFRPVNGIICDFGMSSWNLDASGRGFSFKKNEPLDMRYDRKGELTAALILNSYPEKDLEKILREFGEERMSRKIAQVICRYRAKKKILTTENLMEVIRIASPRRYLDPSRVFQALRIETNKELENIKTVLREALDVLESGGRLAVISFHSLEDRIVKNFFNDLKKESQVKILTKKPVVAGREEATLNPRSRSAKLRAFQKI